MARPVSRHVASNVLHSLAAVRPYTSRPEVCRHLFWPARLPRRIKCILYFFYEVVGRKSSHIPFIQFRPGPETLPPIFRLRYHWYLDCATDWTTKASTIVVLNGYPITNGVRRLLRRCSSDASADTKGGISPECPVKCGSLCHDVLSEGS